jgi:hypothetical protein
LFLDSGKKNGAEPFAACAIRFSSASDFAENLEPLQPAFHYLGGQGRSPLHQALGREAPVFPLLKQIPAVLVRLR